MGPDQHILAEIQVKKDIGIYIVEKLNFETHMEEKINKVNAIMGTIRRTFDHLNEKTFQNCIKHLSDLIYNLLIKVTQGNRGLKIEITLGD